MSKDPKFIVLERRYLDLIEEALKRLDKLVDRLVKERKDVLDEHKLLEKERADVKASGEVDYAALKDNRLVYQAILKAIELQESYDAAARAGKAVPGTAAHKARIKKAADLAKAINIEGGKVNVMIRNMYALEETQLRLQKDELDGIDEDIRELGKIKLEISKLRTNKSSKEVEMVAYQVESIQASISHREKQTKEKIAIVQQKKKILTQVGRFEAEMTKRGLKISDLVAAVKGKIII